jgi:hypothetical protein
MCSSNLSPTLSKNFSPHTPFLLSSFFSFMSLLVILFGFDKTARQTDWHSLTHTSLINTTHLPPTRPKPLWRSPPPFHLTLILYSLSLLGTAMWYSVDALTLPTAAEAMTLSSLCNLSWTYGFYHLSSLLSFVFIIVTRRARAVGGPISLILLASVMAFSYLLFLYSLSISQPTSATSCYPNLNTAQFCQSIFFFFFSLFFFSFASPALIEEATATNDRMHYATHTHMTQHNLWLGLTIARLSPLLLFITYTIFPTSTSILSVMTITATMYVISLCLLPLFWPTLRLHLAIYRKQTLWIERLEDVSLQMR